MVRNRSSGFTLLELMVVVFIISILAAVAIPLVNKYLKKSRTTEASLNLRKIYDGEVAYYEEERISGGGSVISKRFIAAGPDPASPGNQKQSGNWAQPEWEALKFGTDGPVFFSYRVIATGVGLTASFTARAEGDLDGDSVTSLFERVASVNSTTGEVEGGAAIFSLDEIE